MPVKYALILILLLCSSSVMAGVFTDVLAFDDIESDVQSAGMAVLLLLVIVAVSGEVIDLVRLVGHFKRIFK